MCSPAAVAFRGLVMLIFLVAIPAIALFWKSIPGVVDKALTTCNQNGISLPWFKLQAARQGPSPVDAREDELADAPRFDSLREFIATFPEPRRLSAGQPADAAMRTLSSAASRSPSSRPNVGHVPGRSGGDSYVKQAGHEMPLPAGAAAAMNRQGATLPPGQQPAPVDRFTAIQERLRSLGAIYYLLESWGTDGSQFRFHCKMAIAGNSRYTRHFEATDTQPLRAMARVLQSVEDWRSGRQP